MRFAFFSSLISRSSTARSSLQGLVALSALVVLTGAKGQGCGSVDVPTTPPEPDCGPGFHWETVCSPCEIGEMCEEQCVPDNVCPPGWSQQTFCGGSSTSVTTSAGQGGMAGGVAMPMPPDECWTECVPPQPFCPPGTIEQTVCSGGVTTTTATAGSGGWTGSSVGVGGAGGMDGGVGMPMPPGDCWTECVPVEPYCPPGTQAQEICYDGIPETTVSVGTGYGSGGGWGGCFIECVPVEPYCPPGTLEQKVCSGAGSTGTGMDDAAYPGECWIECVEGAICPPEAIKRTICEEPAGGGSPPVCRTECVLMLP